MRSLSLLLVGMLVFTVPGQAQFQPGGSGASQAITGKIIGTIIDSVTRDVLSYATVALRRAGSTKDINGTLTDDKGIFKLENISQGKYIVTINSIGYVNKVISNIELTLKKPDANIGRLQTRRTEES